MGVRKKFGTSVAVSTVPYLLVLVPGGTKMKGGYRAYFGNRASTGTYWKNKRIRFYCFTTHFGLNFFVYTLDTDFNTNFYEINLTIYKIDFFVHVFICFWQERPQNRSDCPT
jgi:hypothetical protein